MLSCQVGFYVAFFWLWTLTSVSLASESYHRVILEIIINQPLTYMNPKRLPPVYSQAKLQTKLCTVGKLIFKF
jgi:hypothetical protein